ncbi:MAG: DUF4255 domain-containing protein [Alphaproteobacteria bacterium]|nr:DUF4255 domain-containing protein [Alphaproteobacteria bacterium]
MSNFLAIGAVTAAIEKIISQSVTGDVTGSQVEVGNPSDVSSASGIPTVNLFLFQVTPNAQLRNMNVPTRGSSGLMRRPQVALDLHYLVTFHGNHANLEPERLMGSTVVALEAHPVLTASDIADGISAYASPSVLDTSDLADQLDRVRLTQQTLSIEELTNLWTAFPDAPFLTSLIYTASVVLMEAQVSARTPYPVSTAALYVRTFQQPQIDTIKHEDGASVPIEHDSAIVLRGSSLRATPTVVSIDGVEVTMSASVVRATRIDVDLGTDFAGLLPAGVLIVRVRHPVEMDQGGVAVEHTGFTSNSIPIVLHPTITVASSPDPVTVSQSNSDGTSDGTITIGVQPALQANQDVRLQMNGAASPSQGGYQLTEWSYSESAQEVTFNFANVASGPYVVRLYVDGAESVLTQTSPDDLYAMPTVEVP